MDLTRAAQLVANDQRYFDDILTVADAIEHTLDVLRLPEEPAVLGARPVEGDDEVAQAYLTVLRYAKTSTDFKVAAVDIADHAGADFCAEYARSQKVI